MIHALECKHVSKGIFQVDLKDNKILLWCAVVLVLTTFPVIYIPRINDDVFLVGSLKWEWGIVVSSPTHTRISRVFCAQPLIDQFGMIIVYLAATEAYKWIKRIFLRRKGLIKEASNKTLTMERTIAPV